MSASEKKTTVESTETAASEKAKAAAASPAEAVLSVLTLGLLVLCIMNAAATTYHPFIYFRF